MAIFKICRGAEANLPSTKTDGYAYFTTDTGNFYIDYKNTSNTLVRSKLSAEYAEKLRYSSGSSTIEIDPSKILTDDNYATKIGSASTTKAGLMSAGDKSKLDGIATNANNYTHPSYTAKSSGLYKITVDSSGHISGTTAVAKSDITALGIPSTNTTYSSVTAGSSTPGLMTGADKTKLDGVATGAEVNQNAFSNIVVGSTTIAADSKTDTLTLAGSNVTITPDATNDKVTIGITKANVTSALGYTPPTTNTTYDVASTTANGLMSKADKEKLDGIASGADNVSFSRSLTSGTKVGTITINGTGTDLYAPTNTDTHYASGTVVNNSTTATTNTTTALTNGNVYINHIENGAVKNSHKISGSGAVTVTTDTSSNIVIGANAASTTAAGLMSKDDKTKLDGIAASANNYSHPTYTTRTGAPTANQTPAFGGTFSVTQPVSDSTGHITAMNSRTVTIPNTTATTSTAGLMSASDKSKLDGIASGANAYVHPSYTARTGKPTANATPGFGSTFTVSQITSDGTGHVTGATDRTIKIPSATATTSAAGLMSSTDKSKLDGIASGAEKNIVYVGPTEPTDPNIKVWINTSEEGTGVVPVLPRIATITLTASGWTGSASPYSQTVTVPTVTTSTKIDLLPTVSQIVSLQNDDIALMAENDENGQVSVYSFGGKPSSDMTMQVQLMEVAFV